MAESVGYTLRAVMMRRRSCHAKPPTPRPDRPRSASTTGLAYTLWLPEQPPLGGFVVLHGAGSRKENHHDVARAARAAGFAALCFDRAATAPAGGPPRRPRARRRRGDVRARPAPAGAARLEHGRLPGDRRGRARRRCRGHRDLPGRRAAPARRAPLRPAGLPRRRRARSSALLGEHDLARSSRARRSRCCCCTPRATSASRTPTRVELHERSRGGGQAADRGARRPSPVDPARRRAAGRRAALGQGTRSRGPRLSQRAPRPIIASEAHWPSVSP